MAKRKTRKAPKRRKKATKRKAKRKTAKHMSVGSSKTLKGKAGKRYRLTRIK